jgi:hypothetical protein
MNRALKKPTLEGGDKALQIIDEPWVRRPCERE